MLWRGLCYFYPVTWPDLTERHVVPPPGAHHQAHVSGVRLGAVAGDPCVTASYYLIDVNQILKKVVPGHVTSGDTRPRGEPRSLFPPPRLRRPPVQENIYQNINIFLAFLAPSITQFLKNTEAIIKVVRCIAARSSDSHGLNHLVASEVKLGCFALKFFSCTIS